MTSGGARSEDDAARGAPKALFVSDASVEAERIAQTLRGVGYVVVDVPLSMLVARVAVQRPRVVLIDSDADGALEAVGRMRELPDADGIDVLFFGRLGGVFAKAEDAMAHEGSGFFERPVDVPSLVKKVDALTGGAESPHDSSHDSTPPPSIPAASLSSRLPGPASLPPASMRQVDSSSSRPPPPRPSQLSMSPRVSQFPSQTLLGSTSLSTSPSSGSGEPSRRAVMTPLSSELEQLLAEAEQRVPIQISPESVAPTPEEELEAVLPAEMLDALDGPIAEEDDDDFGHDAPMSRTNAASLGKHTTGVGASSGTGVGTGSERKRTSAAPKPMTGELATPAPPKTHGGTHGGSSGAGSTGPGSDAGRGSSDGAAETEPPPSRRREGSPPSPTAFSAPPGDSVAPPSLADRPRPMDPMARTGQIPAASRALSSEDESPRLMTPIPSVLGSGDAPRTVARAIALRTTGALAFNSDQGVRRVLLREGDAVTVVSTSEEETLLAFLGVRGELPRETVRRLVGKFPAFGRHAGAALVAHGYLRQDQLWPTLRAHAEWILGLVLQSTIGTVTHEPEALGRLRGEPGVFGGSTGAEVFVEVLRRVVPQALALERIGGALSRVGDGEHASILSECALSQSEASVVTQARGRTVQQVLDAAPDSDLATVLYALSLLGVVEVLRAVGQGGKVEQEGEIVDVDALDEDAVRARVRARAQLVDEGDYFAVLGVARSATGYEVRRAFLELRRAFEPSRLLTPQVADLADEVRKIVVVLEEAYEILKDAARRERYRRAIDTVPAP